MLTNFETDRDDPIFQNFLALLKIGRRDLATDFGWQAPECVMYNVFPRFSENFDRIAIVRILIPKLSNNFFFLNNATALSRKAPICDIFELFGIFENFFSRIAIIEFFCHWLSDY